MSQEFGFTENVIEREGEREREENEDRGNERLSRSRERERESQPHEWGERRFNQASSKYRAPQSHFKTCRDIFIHNTHTQTLRAVFLFVSASCVSLK